MIYDKPKPSARIAWISGLKGIACYGVFIHHFFLVMVPETYYGTVNKGIAWLLSSSPLGVLINGNFYVFLFIMLSAYLIAKPLLDCPAADFRSKIGTTSIKRYFRLMLPILAYGCIRQILVTAIHHWGISFRIMPYPSWWFIVRHSVYDTFVQSDSSITGPLWMLSDLFLGSYLVLLLSLPDRVKAGKWIFLIYPVAFLITEFRIRNFYLSASVCGILLSDIQIHWEHLLQYKKLYWVPKAFILIGLFLGGVPTHLVPEVAACYHFATKSAFFYHCRGAFLLLLGLIGEHALTCQEKKTFTIRILENKSLQYLGTISFSIFLIHDSILTAIESPLKVYLMEQCNLSLKLTSLIALTVLSVLVVSISTLFYHGIEKQTNRICQYIHL